MSGRGAGAVALRGSARCAEHLRVTDNIVCSRDAFASELCAKTKKRSGPCEAICRSPLKGGLPALRMIPKSSHRFSDQTMRRTGSGAPKGASYQWPTAYSFPSSLVAEGVGRGVGLRALSEPARLPALHCGSRLGDRTPQLSFRPCFLRCAADRRYRSSAAGVQRAPRGPVLMPVGTMPKAARERTANPPAGTASRSTFGSASRKRPC